MSHGFGQVSKAGQAPVISEGAEDLLVNAFPDLTDAQRRAVLAATEIDSGYPPSEGRQRIDLAAAPEPSGSASSQQPSATPKPTIDARSSPAKPDKLAHTGADARYFVPAAALLLLWVGTIAANTRRKATNPER